MLHANTLAEHYYSKLIFPMGIAEANSEKGWEKLDEGVRIPSLLFKIPRLDCGPHWIPGQKGQFGTLETLEN